MLKKILIVITLSLLVLLGNYAVQSAAGRNRSGELNQKTTDAPTGTLQKMIVENGSVAMDLDLNRLNGINSPTQSLQQAHFAVGANSFFPVLVFNDLLRGPMPGSMALIPQNVPALPAACWARLSSSSQSKNFLQVKDPILPCATATQDSHFSTSRGTSTTTTLLRSRLPSAMAGFSFQKSLPTLLAARPMPVQSLERSPSARRCSRPRSRSLLTGNRNQWSCHRCNMELSPRNANRRAGAGCYCWRHRRRGRPGKQRDTGWSGNRN